MKAMRVVYVFAALCGGLALGYSPGSASAAEVIRWDCSDCRINSDGTATCDRCEPRW
jgi:hypothetical protein